MNPDQWLSLLRTLLKIGGMFLVSKGVLTDVDWTTISGAVIMLAPVGWDIYVHSKAGKLASVAAMPEVKKIVTDPETAVEIDHPKVTT